MKTYDHIVVGSGVSGLTMSLLLAMNGRKILLVEKSPRIGGSLSRFTRSGIPFETGFHFTGGLQDGGILSDILTFLGLRDAVEPIFLSNPSENRFIFESAGRTFEHPSGIQNVIEQFKTYFPDDILAIERYFEMVQSVCKRTPSLNLRDNTIALPNLDEDYASLDDVLGGLTSNKLLRGLLSGYAMCYGVRPCEISFANHSRMVLNFYESIAFVNEGGDAIVKAFKEKFKDYDIDIRCQTFITELADISSSTVNRFVLNTGEEVSAESCIFTIHPLDILKLLPEKHYSRAFASRVAAFESSIGFFSVFGTLKAGSTDPIPDTSIVSLFPDTDINKLLDPSYAGTPALVLIKPPNQGERKGLCILEPSFAEHVSAWQDTARGMRPESYLDYKKTRLDVIREHICTVFPAFRESLDFSDAGSMLTFKDYLNNPDGSAYGVKQKLRQFNLIGKLPLHNLFAAGQNALLPGVIGAMMSSLIVGRSIMGKEQYGRLLSRTLCH